ncbi:wiskott-Aldrich syndrome protein homolog 1-like [Neopelma chrysocephalum]|uniref:wiskott-Aldrich syndrome protein homolog 1-like n=1 Tax=Neopelma chrysocephalum TaxID=114329 RepID=UPI000FCD1E15|nr:wiskott-Aldrich syndrome protein homolog 1-like [Neopelma chrysocephalum]
MPARRSTARAAASPCAPPRGLPLVLPSSGAGRKAHSASPIGWRRRPLIVQPGLYRPQPDYPRPSAAGEGDRSPPTPYFERPRSLPLPSLGECRGGRALRPRQPLTPRGGRWRPASPPEARALISCGCCHSDSLPPAQEAARRRSASPPGARALIGCWSCHSALPRLPEGGSAAPPRAPAARLGPAAPCAAEAPCGVLSARCSAVFASILVPQGPRSGSVRSLRVLCLPFACPRETGDTDGRSRE